MSKKKNKKNKLHELLVGPSWWWDETYDGGWDDGYDAGFLVGLGYLAGALDQEEGVLD